MALQMEPQRSRSRSADRLKPKKLVVLADGTWMDSDGGKNQVPSNVTRLARATKAIDSEKNAQIVYYQAGIGTGIGLMSQLLGGGTGLGFSENVREAYAFLANNYQGGSIDQNQNDRIFLVGFSRGAYTARSLGGLVAQLGLLKKEYMNWFPDIFKDWQNNGNPDYEPQFWKKWSKENERMGRDESHSLTTAPGNLETVDQYLDEYRRGLLAYGLTREAELQAIGVFDTVGALGIPVNPFVQKVFHLGPFLHRVMWTDTKFDPHIKNFFHALALDEHRAPFLPAISENPKDLPTNLKQVWFAGPHSSVGGAYADIAQANITMAWMMDQLSGWDQQRDHPEDWKASNWLEFDMHYLEEQFKCNAVYQQDTYTETNDGKRCWGLGAIYNSLTFPQVLAGSRTRKPGRTHPAMYPTDRLDKNKLLKNTNERVHASVRVRIVKAGKDFEQDPDATSVEKVISAVAGAMKSATHTLLHREGKDWYQPHVNGALQDWDLRDGQAHHDDYSFDTVTNEERQHGKPPVWKYVGSDPLVPKNTYMPEDRLGRHELFLLKQYGEDVAEWVESTNVGRAPTEALPDGRDRSLRPSITM